jgi:uncharacterized membrane protein YkvI
MRANRCQQPLRILGVTMDIYEKLGYSLLAIIVIIYMIAMFIGMIATFPYGLLGLIFVAGVGILMIKVLKERIRNKEDDYYSSEVDK